MENKIHNTFDLYDLYEKLDIYKIIKNELY